MGGQVSVRGALAGVVSLVRRETRPPGLTLVTVGLPVGPLFMLEPQNQLAGGAMEASHSGNRVPAERRAKGAGGRAGPRQGRRATEHATRTRPPGMPAQDRATRGGAPSRWGRDRLGSPSPVCDLSTARKTRAAAARHCTNIRIFAPSGHGRRIATDNLRSYHQRFTRISPMVAVLLLRSARSRNLPGCRAHPSAGPRELGY